MYSHKFGHWIWNQSWRSFVNLWNVSEVVIDKIKILLQTKPKYGKFWACASFSHSVPMRAFVSFCFYNRPLPTTTCMRVSNGHIFLGEFIHSAVLFSFKAGDLNWSGETHVFASRLGSFFCELFLGSSSIAFAQLFQKGLQSIRFKNYQW